MAKDETALMRECSPLYASFALESLFTVAAAVTFMYLFLLITNKGRLERPGHAFLAFMKDNVSGFLKEIWMEAKRWNKMGELNLEQRFAFCRKMNQAMVAVSAGICLLTVTRWFHVNNINGIRYIGWAVTCPIMHAQLVLLIAPVVPCFKAQTVLLYGLTMIMLLSGYVGSLLQEPLLEGWEEPARNWDLLGAVEAALDTTEFSTKFWFVAVSVCIEAYITFIHIPLLALIFCCRGRQTDPAKGLPHGYLKLLLIVQASWLAFRAWWLLSYEGLAVIKDTKVFGAGFAVLNVLSKATFTLQLLRMYQWHRHQKRRQDALAKGRRVDEADINRQANIFQTESARSLGSFRSMASTVNTESSCGPETLTAPRSQNHRETWLVQALRPYDKVLPDIRWADLEPPARAYLLGNGIQPVQFKQMPLEDRRQLVEEYKSIFDVMIDDHPKIEKHITEASDLMDESQKSLRKDGRRPSVTVPLTPEMPEGMPQHNSLSSLETDDNYPVRLVSGSSTRAGELEPDRENSPQLAAVFEGPSDQATPRHSTLEEVSPPEVPEPYDRPPTHSTTAPMPMTEDREMQDDEEEADLPPQRRITVGQKLTTSEGIKGRVLEVLEDQVKLAVPGNRKMLVPISDIATVVINLTEITGSVLEEWKANVASKGLYVACTVQGKHGCKVRTPKRKINFKAYQGAMSIAYHCELFGYSPGDTLCFTVWGVDGSDAERCVGEAQLEGAEFEDDGFEGKLPIATPHGVVLRAQLNVMVVLSGLGAERTTSSQGSSRLPTLGSSVKSKEVPPQDGSRGVFARC